MTRPSRSKRKRRPPRENGADATNVQGPRRAVGDLIVPERGAEIPGTCPELAALGVRRRPPSARLSGHRLHPPHPVQPSGEAPTNPSATGRACPSLVRLSEMLGAAQRVRVPEGGEVGGLGSWARSNPRKVPAFGFKIRGAPMPRNPRGSGGFVVLRSRHGNVYSGRSDFSEILRIAMATEELAEGAGLRSCRPAACGLRPAPRLSFPGPSSSPDAAEPAAVRVARRADRNGRRGAWPSRRLGRARGQGQAGHAGARSLASGTLMIPCSIIDRKGRCR